MGWAEGLNAGINLGNVIKQGMLQQDLAEEAKKYKLGEGAYGQGLQTNIENLQAAREANLAGLEGEQLAAATKAYDQAQAELTRRAGLTAPEYYIQGDTTGRNYSNRQEAESALVPMRTAGLADVYRSYGQLDKASELEARSQQQQLTAYQLSKAQRENAEDVNLANFNADVNKLENPNDLNAVKALAAQHKLTRAQQFSVASQMSGIEESELKILDAYVKKVTKGKDLDGLLDLHKNDKNFADGTHFVKAVGKDGQVILNLVSDADPTKVIRTESFKDADLATSYLRKQAEDPANVAEWMLGVRAKQADIAYKEGETSLIPFKKGLYSAQATAWSSKPDAAATAAESRQFLELTKTDAWKNAERKHDTAAMRTLMVDRGLDPAKHGGGGGAPGWDAKPAAPAAAAKPTGVDTKKPAKEEPKKEAPKVDEKAVNSRYTWQQQQAEAAAAREKAIAERKKRDEQAAIEAQRADEVAAANRAALAADFRRNYGLRTQ